MSVISSGLTVKVTVTDASVVILPATPGTTHRNLKIYNQGPEPGFYRIGGGDPQPIAGDFFFIDEGVLIGEDADVTIERVAGGSNMTEVFASKW